MIGAVAAVILSALWSLGFFKGPNSSIWLIVVGVAQFGAVMGVTYAMQLITGRKYATSLRIIAAVLALLFYIAEVMAIHFA